MAVEVKDVAPGLWIWRLEHPERAPHVGWDPPVTFTCEPLHGRAAFERALELEPCTG